MAGLFLYQESKLDFHPLPSTPSSCILEGYFQSEEYFANNHSNIFNDLTLPSIPPEVLKRVHLIKEDASVMIHVRRGDYISNQNTASIYAQLGYEYYSNCITLKELPAGQSLRFHVFSDDIEWCKRNFCDSDNIIFHTPDLERPEIDLYTMSMCKYFIIANSSFSWWSATLSYRADKIVMAPANWFKNKSKMPSTLIPSSWIKINNRV